MQTIALVNRQNTLRFCCVVITVLLVLCHPQLTQAQVVDPERERAFQLYEDNKFTDAVPLLEKLAKAAPSDVVVLSRLGFALYATSTVIKDPEERKRARTRARNILERAQSLGDNSVLTKVTIDTLTANEGGEVSYSQLQAADRAMQEGEAAFVRGDFAAAIKYYDEALAADPRLYEAALYKGDVYFKSNQQEKAGEWFAKAIKIDPDRETAYRYWGDSLMKQGKSDEAREKFIEAYIAEPYSRLARNGFVRWANEQKLTLAHPRIDVPTNVTPLKDGKMTINLDPSTFKDDGDGSSAWMMYGLSRASWATSEFAKNYPHIIIDDGSTDGSKEIVRKFSEDDKRIVLLERKSEKKGAPVCRNIGLTRANGNYLIFLDSDDLLAPWALEMRYQIISLQSEFDAWVFQGLEFLHTPGDSNRLWFQVEPNMDFLSSFLKGNTLWQTSGPIWKKELLLQKKVLWNEDVKIWQDSNFHKHALVKGLKFHFSFESLPDYFIRRSLNQTRISSGERDKEMIKEKMKVLASEIEMLEQSGVDVKYRKKQLLQKYIYHIYKVKRDFKTDYSEELLHVLSKIKTVRWWDLFLLKTLFNTSSSKIKKQVILKLIDLTSIKFWDNDSGYKFSKTLSPVNMTLLKDKLLKHGTSKMSN
jgi:glycosyltransferase involved in cell wall biosynthesis